MRRNGVVEARTLRLAALLLLAPILAGVLLVTLLVVGVDPHLVFLPGHFLKGRLEALGFRVPNPVGVLTTFALWWLIIVVVWVGLRRLLQR